MNNRVQLKLKPAIGVNVYQMFPSLVSMLSTPANDTLPTSEQEPRVSRYSNPVRPLRVIK